MDEPMSSHRPASGQRRAVRDSWIHVNWTSKPSETNSHNARWPSLHAERRPNLGSEVDFRDGLRSPWQVRRQFQRSSHVVAKCSLAALVVMAAVSRTAAITGAPVQSVPLPSGGRGEGGFIGVFPDSRSMLPRINLPEIRSPSIQIPRVEMPSLQLPKISPQGLCNLLAGGVAGAVASAITCPLEVVKTQLQSRSQSLAGLGPLGVARKIVSEQGVKGLYRGLSPTVVGIIPTRSLYFWAYGAAKAELEPVMGDTPATHMTAAVAAGGLSNTVTCPLWVTKTRMQLEGTSFTATVKNLVSTQGVGGFYRGLLPSYWGLSEGAIQFLLYEKLKRSMAGANAEGGKAELTTVQYLAAAGLSKAVASGLTYPHEVVRTRMREAASARYEGFFQSIRLIAKEEGARGLYGGLGPHLMRVVPNTAIMFMSFELLSRRLPAILEDRPWERVVDSLHRELQPPRVAERVHLLARGLAHSLPTSRPAPSALC